MLSTGPYNYNRFDLLEKNSKPDFLDKDKDGDEKESMKKAIEDKKSGCSKCEGECECDDKKSDKKEEVEITKDDVIAHLVENNYANNEVSAEVLFTHISDEFLENIEEELSLIHI